MGRSLLRAAKDPDISHAAVLRDYMNERITENETRDA